MKNILASAIALAAKAHENQIDKGGNAYILHPLRMMMRLRTDDEELMAIAVLHDVVEDSDLNCRDLMEMGYSARIIAGVDALSRKDGETYDQFIKRCSHNPDAKLVKREDLRDNFLTLLDSRGYVRKILSV